MAKKQSTKEIMHLTSEAFDIKFKASPQSGILSVAVITVSILVAIFIPYVRIFAIIAALGTLAFTLSLLFTNVSVNMEEEQEEKEGDKEKGKKQGGGGGNNNPEPQTADTNTISVECGEGPPMVKVLSNKQKMDKEKQVEELNDVEKAKETKGTKDSTSDAKEQRRRANMQMISDLFEEENGAEV